MAEMDVGRGGIEALLDAQRPPRRSWRSAARHDSRI